jgi:hypothetical protein
MLLSSPTASRSGENGDSRSGENERRERERMEERDREWMRENHKRAKKKLTSGIVCDTVQ